VAKTLRVHTLAKELGVPSKAIIDKCNAEGVLPELKNHMAAISAGLAESIREWFSSGEDVTTVEVAPIVDLEELHIERQAIQRKRKRGGEDEDAGEVAVAVTDDDESERADFSDDEVEDASSEAVETVVHELSDPTERATGASAAEILPATAADASDQTALVEESEQAAPAAPAPLSPAAKAASQPVKAPDLIKPAGPQLVPAPAELRGPRVVRIEAPEPVRAPRPRPAAQMTSGDAPELPAGGPPREGLAGRRRKEQDGPGKGRPAPRRQGGDTELREREREWRDQDLIERRERLASATGHGFRARRSAERRRQSTGGAATVARKSEIEITTPIALKDFCAAVGAPFSVVSKKLLDAANKLVRINESIDAEMAELVALELGVALTIRRARTAFEKLQDEVAARERKNLKPRPPVVTMLGHVDHGKTSLLDAIRKTSVTAGEAGGITQHIGAYRVDRGDWHVTFLDTPGHEAFTSMRARGANLTDVVVLVIAADDGVMRQTVEAINHAKAANATIVVALNKIDLAGIDEARIYGQLAEHELTPTEWSGTVDVIRTSATTGRGIDELIAHLSTLSELLDLQADPTVPAAATVIEAHMREGRGAVAQVLVREGTLKPGAIFVCGPAAGRIRSLSDDRGRALKQAGPGTPAEVVGLDALPRTGDGLYVLKSLAEAKSIAAEVQQQRRQEALAERQTPQSLEELLRGAEENETPELNVIVKADVQGSLEALSAKLGEFPSDKARLKILHAGIGAISEADVALAKASRAVVIGFHVVAEERARQAAERDGVDIRVYRIIYEVTDDVQKALEGLLEPDHRAEQRGRVEVREIFHVTKVGTVAGCMVMDGVIARDHRVRLTRDGRIIAEGLEISSLKRFKNDAKEVRTGLECGVKLAGFDDVKPGDIFEAYELVEVAQRLQ